MANKYFFVFPKNIFYTFYKKKQCLIKQYMLLFYCKHRYCIYSKNLGIERQREEKKMFVS